ncbi:MAG: AsmA-like C-terminal region-containing protein, partial [Bdellovibrionales bacterium]|nr:AsmA-like C-terminal region-containing protein [Bdellovibrionales bacterium]
PLNLELKGTFEPNPGALDLSTAFVVNDFKVLTDLDIQNFENPKIVMKIKSDKLMLENWQKIIAPIGKFEMTGAAALQMSVNYENENPTYSGDVSLSAAGLRAPGLVPPVRDLSSRLVINTNHVKLAQTSMMIGESDIGVSGDVKNFNSPVINIEASSRLMNLDEMLGLPAKAELEKAAPKQVEKSAAEQDREMEAMAQGPIDLLKKNSMMRNLVFRSQTKIAKLIMKKVSMTNVAADLNFEKLVMSMKEAKMNLFGGSATSRIFVDFNGKDPEYKLGGAISGLDMDEAITSQFADLKGFLTGKTSANFDVIGAGVAPSKVKQSLRGGGQFDLKDGTWSALGVLQKIGEKIQQIPGARDKLGGVKVGNKFKTLGGRFTIENGGITLINVAMELAEGNTGLVVNGRVNFDKTIAMTGILKFVGSDIPKRIQGSDGRANVPFELRGLMMSPEVLWEKTLTPLATAYAEQEAKKAVGKAAEQGLQKIKENIKDENLKKVLENQNAKDLLKKIGF